MHLLAHALHLGALLELTTLADVRAAALHLEITAHFPSHSGLHTHTTRVIFR